MELSELSPFSFSLFSADSTIISPFFRPKAFLTEKDKGSTAMIDDDMLPPSDESDSESGDDDSPTIMNPNRVTRVIESHDSAESSEED